MMREKMKTTNGITKKELKQVLISDLIPYKTNPRKNDDAVAGVAASLQEFGYIKNSIIIDENNVLLAGHTTLKAMLSLGWDKAPEVTQVFGLSEIKKKAYRIADNKLGEKAEWDAQLLINELESIKIEGLDINITGFNEKELVTFMADLNKGKDPLDAEPQISRAEELRKEWGTELGQLWQCGEHFIVCGDCTDPAVVKRLMGDEKADLVTDPPYGIKRDKGFEGAGGFKGDGKPIPRRRYEGSNWDADRPSKETFNTLLNISESALIFGGNFFADILPQGKHWIVWDKKNTMPTFGDCELIWTNLPRTSVKKIIFEYNGLIGKEKERHHPTQKPVALIVNLLSEYLKDGRIVLDPFLGSGTTMIACENLGRKCRGIEIDPGYLGVILERYKTTFNKMPVLLEDD